MTELLIETISSPLGSIDVVAQSNALVSVDFSDCRERMHRLLEKRVGPFVLIPQPHDFGQRLRSYFAGNLQAIDHAAVVLKGTPFQNRVWSQLSTVPAGITVSYGHIAQQLDQPQAAQAVGRANSQNPILIFLPCHRIVGKNKKMVGYSAGIHRKTWLLHHEQVHSL